MARTLAAVLAVSVVFITGCTPANPATKHYQKVADDAKWDPPAGALLELDDVQYRAHFNPISTGCTVVAFDRQANKQLWETELKGIGPVGHSKYRNEVRMGVLDDDTLVVYGDEAYGKYIEILDRKTGKTVGHKVFKEEKAKAEK